MRSFSNPRMPGRRSASTRSRRFGFPTDWNVTIVDRRGRVAYDNIPTEVGEWYLSKGDDFVSESGYDGPDVDEAGGLLPFLMGNFSVVVADGLFFVGDNVSSVSRALSEWETREDRMPPAEIAGMGLSQGSREGVAIVTFEGRPRPDMAAYVDALAGFNWRCDPSSEYISEGWFGNLRMAADLDPEFLSQFAEGNLPDEPQNAYDREIIELVHGVSASVRGRSNRGRDSGGHSVPIDKARGRRRWPFSNTHQAVPPPPRPFSDGLPARLPNALIRGAGRGSPCLLEIRCQADQTRQIMDGGSPTGRSSPWRTSSR